MIRRVSVTTAANVSQDNPTITEFRLTRGIIHSIDMIFPPGSGGLLHARILRGSEFIVPDDDENYFHGDNNHYKFESLWWLSDEPFTIKIETWNEDTAYEHGLQVIISEATTPSEILARDPALFIDTLITRIQPTELPDEVSLFETQRRILAFLDLNDGE